MRWAGLLLTGGTSRRLGQDKAGLRLIPGGPTLAEAGARILAAETALALEVGPGWSGLPAVEESHEPQGPLVALAAGWRALSAERSDCAGVVLLACDMPLVSGSILRWLVAHPTAGTVVPLAGTPPRAQPLCARWARDDLERLADLVGAGERSLRSLLDAADVTYAPSDTWLPHAGPAGQNAFDDVDTPAALARIRGRYAESEP